MADIYDNDEYLRQLIEERRRAKEALLQVEQQDDAVPGMALAGLAGTIGDAIRGGGNSAQNIAGMMSERSKGQREARLKALSGNDDTIKALVDLNKNRQLETRQQQQFSQQEKLQSLRDQQASARLEKQLASAEKRSETSAGSKSTGSTERQIQKYSDKTADLSEVVSQISNIQELLDISDTTQDVPGFGQTGFLPDIALSGKGQRIRQSIEGLRNSILKARSGGAVTPAEASRLLTELGSGSMRDDQQLLAGLRNTFKNFKEIALDREVVLSPEAKDMYRERRGTLLSERFQVPQPRFAAPTESSAIPTATAGQRVKVTNGAETFMIDPADLDAAMQDGFRPEQ